MADTQRVPSPCPFRAGERVKVHSARSGHPGERGHVLSVHRHPDGWEITVGVFASPGVPARTVNVVSTPSGETRPPVTSPSSPSPGGARGTTTHP
jgi:hypothetical protein